MEQIIKKGIMIDDKKYRCKMLISCNGFCIETLAPIR